MKKKEFLKLVESKLLKLGFLVVAGKTAKVELHLFKQLKNGLVLNLAIESSKRFAESITASFYLSVSFTWSYLPPTFPKTAYERVGVFLTSDERNRLLSPDFSRAGVVDAWWIGFNEANAISMAAAVGIAEPRFLAQPDLQRSLITCPDLIEHIELIEETRRVRHASSPAPVDGPDDLLAAAEQAIKKMIPGLNNPKVVSRLATDVFRVEKHAAFAARAQGATRTED